MAEPSRPRELLSDENTAMLLEALGTVRRSWRLLVVSMVLCMTSMGLFVLASQRIYQATTRLLILQQGGRPISVANNDPSRLLEGDDDFIPTQILILSSPLVVQKAIDSIGMKNLPTLSYAAANSVTKRPVDIVIENIKITRPDRMAKIISVDYFAYTPEEAEMLLKAITESYKTVLAETYEKTSNDTITLITSAHDKLNEELKGLEQQYVEFCRTLPYSAVDETKRSLVAMRLERSVLTYTQAVDDARRLKYQLELAKKLQSEGMELWSVAHAINQLGGDSTSLNTAVGSEMALGSTTDYVRVLTAEQQQLVQQFGPTNVRARQIQGMINKVQTQTRQDRSQLEGGDIQDLLKSLSESIKSVESLKEETKAQFDKEVEEAKESEMKMLAGVNLQQELERQRELYNSVVVQLKQAQFVSDVTSVTSQVLDPPRAIVGFVSPRWRLLMVVSVILGVMTGLGAIFVLDRLDQRLRTVKELRAFLQAPYLGQIPQIRGEQLAEFKEPGIAIHLSPQSNLAEAYRSVRTNIDFLRRNRQVGVMLVTSPFSGDGKSVTASNLAIAWSQVGLRVLLVDADLRRPSQDQIHGVKADVGLSDVLRETIGLEDAIRKTEFANLDILPGGKSARNPAELLASNKLAEVVEALRGSYDLVLLDSPPILAVTDPSIISSVVDGVIIVVRANILRRHDAEIIKEWIENLGNLILGIVINATTQETQGYGRGYGYGYGYGSYGNYGYGYGGYGGSYGAPYGYGYGAGQDVNPKDPGGNDGLNTHAAAYTNGVPVNPPQPPPKE